VEKGKLIVSRPEKWGGRILLAGVAAGAFVCIDLENAGPRNANAFESELEVKTKPTGSRETTSVKGKVRDVPNWLSIKFDGSLLDLNPARVDPFTSYGFKPLEPIQTEKGAVTDTRVTMGVWDDWVRFDIPPSRFQLHRARYGPCKSHTDRDRGRIG